MNYRIHAAGDMLRSLQVKSVLDVGCRGCEAKKVIPIGAEYYGNDLLQSNENNIAFVGDAVNMDFGRTFDCVIALDIIEHVDNPYKLMDKLISIADKYLLISLPNIYDLIHKYNYVMKNSLGPKYNFAITNSLDRHRWVMNYDEIYEFFSSYSRKYSMRLESKDIIIGDDSKRIVYRISSKIIRLITSRKSMTRTVIALFSK